MAAPRGTGHICWTFKLTLSTCVLQERCQASPSRSLTGQTSQMHVFMESFESRHSNQGFTAQLAKELGVTAPPLRLDSQAKYGEALLSLLGGCCISFLA